LEEISMAGFETTPGKKKSAARMFFLLKVLHYTKVQSITLRLCIIRMHTAVRVFKRKEQSIHGRKKKENTAKLHSSQYVYYAATHVAK
jgi:hypothetical protein